MLETKNPAARALLICTAIAAFLISAPAAQAFPSTGQQKLIVVPIDIGPHPTGKDCPTAPSVLGCPTYTAAEWETRMNTNLNAFFGPATWNQVSWKVDVLENPGRNDGWWPAPHTNDEYLENTKKGATSFSEDPPWVVADAINTLVGEAIKQNVISANEVANTYRFLVLTNYHDWGGQSSGGTYHPTWKVGNTLHQLSVNMTVAYVNEDQIGLDGRAFAIIEHELSHQLGEPDLYAYPCTNVPPGEPGPVGGNCVEYWDPMGVSGSSNIAFGYYSRLVTGWVNPYSPTTRTEPAGFSGPVSLSSIEYPDGDPVALHIPNNPQALILNRAFGNMRYLRGYVLECRRAPSGDVIAPWTNGVLVTYVDDSEKSPEVIVRPHSTSRGDTEGQDFAQWILRPGDTWTNNATKDEVRFNGFDSKGGCSLDLNAPAKETSIAHFMPAKSDSAPSGLGTWGGKSAKAIYSNPGLVVNGPKPPSPNGVKLAAKNKSAKVTAPAPGRASTIQFSYGNAGKAGGGVATVRVEQPYVARAECGSAGPHGRVIGKVKLPKLATGAAGVGKIRWRPKSSAPAAISVSLRGAGEPASKAETATSVIGFQTIRRPRGGGSASAKTELILEVPRKCSKAHSFKIDPAITPQGWKVKVLGKFTPIKPGKRRTMQVKVTAPKGSAATGIPIAVQSGQSTIVPGPRVPSQYNGTGDPELTGGFDLLTRVAARGRVAPSFVLPAPAVLKVPKKSPKVNAKTGIPVDPQSVNISACSTQVIGSPFSVTVEGALTPARSGVPVTLTYAPGLFGPPTSVVVRNVTTDAAGHFTDTFDRQSNDWNVVADVAASNGYVAATSAACAVPVP